MVALTTYTFFRFLHVLLAIVAVGFNASYGILLTRAARDSQHLGHVLRTVKVLDDRFANPAYGLLFVTGMAMVVVGDVDLTQFWLATALVLYAVAVRSAWSSTPQRSGTRSGRSTRAGPGLPSSARS